MWTDLWAALALMLVLEGILPFLSPPAFRRTLAAAADMDDNTMRWVGLLSMAVGVLLLYLVR